MELTYLWSERRYLEDALHCEHRCEYQIEISQNVRKFQRSSLKLKQINTNIFHYNSIESSDLAHEEESVEDDEEHDEVLEGRGGDKPPDVIPHTYLSLGNVNLLGLNLDHVRDAGFLSSKVSIFTIQL